MQMNNTFYELYTNSIKCFTYTVGWLNVKRIDFVNIEIACQTAWFSSTTRVPTRHFAQKTIRTKTIILQQ